MNKLTYIESIFTENTGGGCMVDFIQLDNGKIIALNDECICIYNSLNDFYQLNNNKPLNSYFFK